MKALLPLLVLGLALAACDKAETEPPSTPTPTPTPMASPVARKPADDPKNWYTPTMLDRPATGKQKGATLDQPPVRGGHGR